MANSAEFELNRRRDKLTNIFTNSTHYEELGFGLKELINYTIELEDEAIASGGTFYVKSDI